jgi:hypothetical protein
LGKILGFSHRYVGVGRNTKEYERNMGKKAKNIKEVTQTERGGVQAESPKTLKT